MKLLILTCLVAVALARPKSPVRPREIIQNQPDNHEQEILKQRNFLRLDVATPVELTQEYFNQLNRQRELLRQKESEEIQETRNEATEERMTAETERDSSISSSSEEVAPNAITEEQVKRMSKYNQVQQEQVQRMNKYNQVLQEQLRRMNEYNPIQREPLRVVNQEQVPVYVELIPQINPLNAYPYPAWYYPPQYMANLPLLPFQDFSRPTASENVETTDVRLQL
ncbi:alpha-S1-casein [Otolemur garnettii]|uniref:alpha-S1-casein n=1 Tax=Otolemur garnettii TaxID=30611 RepID=UPI000C7F2BA1|nr:alpha-S1-casein [Otolemur garnettii]